jgi:hypothetical protein
VPVWSAGDDGFALLGCVTGWLLVGPDVEGSGCGADEHPTWMTAADATLTAPKRIVLGITDFLSEDLIEGSGV